MTEAHHELFSVWIRDDFPDDFFIRGLPVKRRGRDADPFAGFMNWILEEKKTKGTVFGIRKPYTADAGQSLMIFGRALETPFGPAAGPHTQLCQNLVAAYCAGSRFLN